MESSSIVLAVYPEGFLDGCAADEILERRLGADPEAALTWANNPIAQVESTQLLHQGGVPVPAVVALDGELGILASHDVGDAQLQGAVAQAGEGGWAVWYAEAVDLIVAIQGCTDAARQRGGLAARLCLGEAKLSWEMAYFDRAFWGDYAGGPAGRLSDEDRRAAMADLRRLCGWIGRRPQVLCHRDFHARNVMVWGGALGFGDASPTHERLVVIDHQDARMGPSTYDLISLLEDPYVNPPRPLHASLWRRWEAAMGHLEGEHDEEALAVTAQRLIKACGTYAHQVAVARKPAFEAHMQPCLQRALEALTELGGYPAAARALEAACQS